jgi:hypothetical protein
MSETRVHRLSLGGAMIRKDHYHGWRLYWHGCPAPCRSMGGVYRWVRGRGFDRRVALAVSLAVPWGSQRGRRYASAHGYPENPRNPTPEED